MMKSRLLRIISMLFFFIIHTIYSQNTQLTFTEQAEEFYNTGQYETLIKFSNTKLQQTIKEKDSLQTARLYYEKGRGQYHKSRHLLSIKSLTNALSYLENFPAEHRLKANIYYFIHINYSIKSYILKELEFGKLSLDEYKKDSSTKKDYDRIFTLYRRLATPSVTIGKYDNAIEYLDSAEKLLNNIPVNYTLPNSKLEYQIALGYQKILISLIETAFFSENYNKNNIKSISKRVIEEKTKLDKLYEENKNLNINFQSYSSGLNFYIRYFLVNREKTDFDVSTLSDDIQKSIQLIDKKDRRRYIHLYLGNQVDVLTYEKSYDIALVLMDSIIKDAGKSHNRYVNFLLQKARILYKKGDVDEGKVWIKNAFQLLHSDTTKLKEDYSNFKPGLKLEDVYLFISVADKITESSTLPLEDKENDMATIYKLAFQQFINTYKTQPLNKRSQQVFKKIIRNLIKYKVFDKAYISEIENVENRLAWQKFTQSRNVVFLPVIDSLEKIEYTLRKQLVNAKIKRNIANIDSLQNEIELYQKKIKKDYPKIADYTQDDFDIFKFQKQIPENEIVLKYLFFKEDYVIFEISKANIKWDIYPWRQSEKMNLRNHLNALQNASYKLPISEELTKSLLPKQSTNGFNTLAIIPDTPLYNLPFETLWFNNDYLMNEKAVRYSSHLRFLFFEDKRIDEDPRATIFAPDYPKAETTLVTRSAPIFLEGAQKEAKALQSFFSSNLYIAEQATKENFVNYKSDGNILHLAMHASLDKNDPVLSYFNFSNSEKLYLEELYALKIPAELAVLSACNTGVGKVEEASGMATLQRAFNYAGTKATIASLWEVPDETTSEIMISFYENLRKGKTKSKALQNAKIEYLENIKISKLKHPYYWAGFVLYGDDSAIVQESNLIYFIITVLLILIISSLIFLKKRKQT